MRNEREVLALIDEAKFTIASQGNPLKALWRLVDAAGLCAEDAGWPESAVGIRSTGRGYRVDRDVILPSPEDVDDLDEGVAL